MKKIFITIIAMLLPLMASADANGTCGKNLTWSYVETTKTLTISGTGEMTNFYSNVPWNSFISSIKNIIIKSGVTSIGSYAFRYCSGLTSVTIPNSVTSIGGSAFYNCSGLTSVTIGNSVTSIEAGAFYGCWGLTSVTIPNSVTSIGDYAFYGCSGLTSVTIPNSVTSIGSSAFSGCSGLTSITIPNSVTSIGSYAFEGTGWYNNQPDGLVYAGNVAYKYKGTMPSNTSISIKDGTLGIAGSAFYSCRGLTSVTIPNSVTSIGGSAFSGCSGLTSITIPKSVTSIGFVAFSSCSGLTSITVNSENTKYDSRDNCNAIIEKSSKKLLTGCKNTIIPNSVTSIGQYAFFDCSGLTSVTIPNSVTSIGGSAFSGCSGLTSVYITDLEAWCKIDFYDYGSNPVYYAKHLFLNGEEIKDLVIPNSVTSIGYDAFRNCSGLTSITIPNSVASIGGSAFEGCSGLTSVSIPNSVESIGSYAFDGCSGLTSITIPNSVTNIGESAFSGCSGLTSIVSLNNTPPTCIQDYYGNYTQFNSIDKANCIVWVPRGSANAYKDADGWKDFQNIRELALGDVNIDFEVNQADLDATTNHIMGQDQEGFYESLADLNNDEAVDAADVVKLVTILNIQDGLSLDWDYSYNSSQMVSSLSCTLNNDGDKTIQLTKCELYNNNKLVMGSNFKVTLAPGESKSRTFSDLASLSVKTGFSVVWYYTYNGESYTYNCDLTE